MENLYKQDYQYVSELSIEEIHDLLLRKKEEFKRISEYQFFTLQCIQNLNPKYTPLDVIDTFKETYRDFKNQYICLDFEIALLVEYYNRRIEAYKESLFVNSEHTLDVAHSCINTQEKVIA